MHQVIKYRLTPEGTIPEFVKDGGYFAIQDYLYPPPQTRFMIGLSVQNPIGDFEVIANQQQLMGLVGCTEIQARSIFSICASYNDGTYPVSNSKQPDPEEIARVQNELQVATNFLINKIGAITQPLTYRLTYFNQETQSNIADLFGNKDYVVKVENGVVSEWYQYRVVVDGVLYFGVSLNPVTNAVEDKYLETQQGFVKLPMDPMEKPTPIINGGWYSIPDENKAQLSNFPYKASIQKWVSRPYGFILEYALPLPTTSE